MSGEATPDFRLQDEGTLSILYAETDAAVEWVDSHIDPDHQTWGGNGVVIEHRYVGPILVAIVEHGLTIEGFNL